jgi:hypothetical protein
MLTWRNASAGSLARRSATPDPDGDPLLFCSPLTEDHEPMEDREPVQGQESDAEYDPRVLEFTTAPAGVVSALAGAGADLDAHAAGMWHHETPLHWGSPVECPCGNAQNGAGSGPSGGLQRGCG